VTAITLLSWNEGRYVRAKRDFKESLEMVRSVINPSIVDGRIDGSLIHVSGSAQTEHYLDNKLFGVSKDALKLWQVVEIYQMVENSRRVSLYQTVP
jgi:hypothetical protein